MARSVSFADGSAWVLYTHLDYDEDDDGYPPELAWDDFTVELLGRFKHAFPSLVECNKWIGREDRALLENGHAFIGVSEYCGLVSVWCVPKEDLYGNDSALAQRWAESIEAKAAKILAEFSDPLVKVATLSNGEALYQRVKA